MTTRLRREKETAPAWDGGLHQGGCIIGSNQFGSPIDPEKAMQSSRGYDGVFVLCPQGDELLPAGDWLTVSYRGGYPLTQAYTEKLLAHAEAHGLAPCGKLVELLWVDKHSTSVEAEYITELQLSVRRCA